MQRDELNAVISNLEGNMGSVLQHTVTAIEESHDADLNMQKSHLAALKDFERQIENDRIQMHNRFEGLKRDNEAHFEGLRQTVLALVGYQQALVEKMEKA